MEAQVRKCVEELVPFFPGIDKAWLKDRVSESLPAHGEQTVEFLANSLLAVGDYPKQPPKEIVFDLTVEGANEQAAHYLDKQQTVKEIVALFNDVDEEWLDKYYDSVRKKHPMEDRESIAGTRCAHA
jgi:hypothetical protein